MPASNPSDTSYAKALSLLPPERGPRQFLLVACPECGTDLVHHCNAAVGAVAAKGKGGAPVHPRTRGSIIVIPAWCEYQHRFNILLGNREGHAEVWTEKRRRAVPGDFTLEEPAPALPPPKSPEKGFPRKRT